MLKKITSVPEFAKQKAGITYAMVYRHIKNGTFKKRFPNAKVITERKTLHRIEWEE